MNKNEFLEELVDLMDTEEELSLETKLEEIEEWDSVSNIAFMAFCATRGCSNIKPTDIKAARTVGDLYNMVRDDSQV
ncbi:hypothetical protein [Anaerovibrio sp.]|uniref:hypothetical protein n=1 Tax=Anaerovibrio sp. TaxID=1872532 RepID=UPI0025C10E47|nr:hypothetical protein [Anaerovibrio sp.]MBR2141994.1 hypothetical protein [Anaerovibrio sp.]